MRNKQRDYHRRRRMRLPLVRALYDVGLSNGDIAIALGASPPTIRNDIKASGFAPRRAGQPFPVAFKLYAELRGKAQDNLDQTELRILAALHDWLDIGAIMLADHALASCEDELVRPTAPAGEQGHMQLVRDVCGVRYFVTEDTLTAGDYMTAVARGERPPPQETREVVAQIARMHADLFRRDVAVPWPQDGAARVEKALAALKSREEEVVRKVYGIGGMAVPLRELAQRLSVSRSRVDQIVNNSLRKLRHSRIRMLRPLIMTLDECKKVVAADELERQRVELMPPDARPKSDLFRILWKPTEELNLSARSANCLSNSGIRYVGELVQKTEDELRRTWNLGRKSLNEIKRVLAEMGLVLGIKIDGWPDGDLPPDAR